MANVWRQRWSWTRPRTAIRYLQTLAEIATENNSTIIFPVPVDMLKAFMSSLDKRGASAT